MGDSSGVTSGASGAGGTGGAGGSSLGMGDMAAILGTVQNQNNQTSLSQAGAAQIQAANNSLALQSQQYDQNRLDLHPYSNAGILGLRQQLNYLGINGPAQQQAFLSNILNGPEYRAMIQSMYSNMDRNSLATGGIRGGDPSAGINYLSPQILSHIINQRYSMLGGLSTIGQNSAASMGTAGMNFANQGSKVYNDLGTSLARNELARATSNNYYNNQAQTYLNNRAQTNLNNQSSQMYSNERPSDTPIPNIPGTN